VGRCDYSLKRLASGIRLEGDTPDMDLLTALLVNQGGELLGRLSTCCDCVRSVPVRIKLRGRHRLGLPMLGIASEDPLYPVCVHAIFRDVPGANYRDLHPFGDVGAEEIFAAERYAYLMLRSLSDVNLESAQTTADIRSAEGKWSRTDCLLVEDFNNAAANRDGHLNHPGDPRFEAADIFNYFLFQCLVGNSDFHFDFSDKGRLQLHNTLLVSREGTQIPIPYDFQYVCVVAPRHWRSGPGGITRIAQRNATMLSEMMETIPGVDFSFCLGALRAALVFLEQADMPVTVQTQYETYLNELFRELNPKKGGVTCL